MEKLELCAKAYPAASSLRFSCCFLLELSAAPFAALWPYQTFIQESFGSTRAGLQQLAEKVLVTMGGIYSEVVKLCSTRNEETNDVEIFLKKRS